jgi:hypothetical protein
MRIYIYSVQIYKHECNHVCMLTCMTPRGGYHQGTKILRGMCAQW